MRRVKVYLLLVIGLMILFSSISCTKRLTKEDLAHAEPSDIKSQIQRLYLPEPAERTAAIRNIEALGEEAADAVPHLIKIFEYYEDDIAIRALAVSALGMIGDKRAVEPLISALKSGYPEISSNAIKSLGMIGDERAMEPLAKLFSRSAKNYRISNAIVNAVEKIGGQKAIETLIGFLSVNSNNAREAICKSLARFGEPAVEPLISALKSDYHTVSTNAAKLLGMIGDKRAVEPLIIELKKKASNTIPIVALGEIGDARAVEPLIKALDSQNQWIRLNVVIALGKIGDQRAIEPVTKAVDDKFIKVRLEAIKVLDEFLGSDTIPILIPLIDSDNSELAKAAADMLDKFMWEPPDISTKITFLIAAQRWDELTEIKAPAVEPLINKLEVVSIKRRSKTPIIVKNIVAALSEIGAPSVEPLINVLKSDNETFRANAVEALGDIGDIRALEPLLAALTGSDKNVRDRAITAVPKLGEPSYEPLISMLKDEDPIKRSSAAQALGNLGDTRAVQSLIPMLNDKEPQVRTGAAWALGKISDSGAGDHLINALHANNDPEVKRSIREALRSVKYEPEKQSDKIVLLIIKMNWEELIRIGEPAVVPLIDEIKYIVSINRWYSGNAHGLMSTLTKIGEPALAPLFEELHRKGSNIKKIVAQALSGMGKPVVGQFIEALESSDPDVRKLSAEALGVIGDKYAVEYLTKAYKDKVWEVRATIITALGKMDDQRAAITLIDALDDNVSDVRTKAVNALKKSGSTYAVEALLKLLKDNNADIRKNAAITLDTLGWKYSNDSEKIDYLIASLKWNDLVVMAKDNDTIFDTLVSLLKVDAVSVKIGAINALGYLRDPRAIEPLTKLVRDDHDLNQYNRDRKMIYAVIDSFEKIGNESVPSLLTMIHHGGVNIRNKVITLLGDMKDRRAIRPFLDGISKNHFGFDYGRKGLSIALKNILTKKDMEKAVSDLKSEDVKTRLDAALILMCVGDQSTVEPLITTISKENDVQVRLSALFALTKMEGPRVAETLLNAMKNDKSFEIRRYMVSPVGKLDDPRVVDTLISALKDGHNDVRKSAARLLMNKGDERAVPALMEALNDKLDQVRNYAKRALDNISPGWQKKNTKQVDSALNKLLIQLREIKNKNPRQVTDNLIAIGQPAVEPLLTIFSDAKESPVTRLRAANILGSIGDKDILGKLLETLRDKEMPPRVRGGAMLGLKNYYGYRGAMSLSTGRRHLSKDPEATKLIISSLMDRDGIVRMKAGEILDRYNKIEYDNDSSFIKESKEAKELLPDFIACIKDGTKDVRVRQAAMSALNRLGGDSAVDALIEVMKDPNERIRSTATRALGQFKDPRAFDHLIHALDDPYEHVRAEAARALGNIGDERAVEPLIAKSNDTNYRVRENVVLSLGEIRDARGLETIITALDDIYPVQKVAVEAIGKFNDRSTIKPLIRVLSHPGKTVRESALKALNRLDKYWYESEAARDSIAYLIPALKFNNTAKIAKRTLNIIDPDWTQTEVARKSVDDFLATLKYNDRNVRKNALSALRTLGWEPSNQDEEITVLIAEQKWNELEKIGKPAITLLALELRHTFNHKNATATLKKIDPDWAKSAEAKKAIPKLISSLIDRDINIRGRSRNTLKKIDPKWKQSDVAKKAVPQLIESLKSVTDKRFINEIINILGRITGNNARNYIQWKEWWDINKDSFLKSD